MMSNLCNKVSSVNFTAVTLDAALSHLMCTSKLSQLVVQCSTIGCTGKFCTIFNMEKFKLFPTGITGFGRRSRKWREEFPSACLIALDPKALLGSGEIKISSPRSASPFNYEESSNICFFICDNLSRSGLRCEKPKRPA